MNTTWADRILAANPFTENRVNTPSDLEAAQDVPAIHAAAFERLTALAREACDERRGLGAVLWGEAGVGKSHVLARLARWAQQEHNAYFVYLHNLQASPENLPRSLLRAVISILTWGRRGGFWPTPLYRLLVAAVSEALNQAGIDRPPVTVRRAEEAFGRWVERQGASDPARAALLDRTVYDVLFRLFRASHRNLKADPAAAAAAVRWLGGDFLDRPDADHLGLPPGPVPGAPAALVDNQQIKQVLVALGRMALCRDRPFVLCFDQVDNLDTAQAAALFRFLEALLDSAPNLLVVTAGIQATLVQWRADKVIQDSAWDRIAQFEVALQRVSPAEAREIVAARLRHVLEPYWEEKAVRQRMGQDPLFPLGQAWANTFFADRAEVRPRDVVNAAREGWRRTQEALRREGADAWLVNQDREVSIPEVEKPLIEPPEEQVRQAIDAKVAQKLAELKARRLAEPYTLPPDADQLAGAVGALLHQCLPTGADYGLLGVQPRPDRRGAPGLEVDLAPRGNAGEERHGRLLFLTTESAQSATAALRRLVREEQAASPIWLVTERRLPLPLAARGKTYFQQLRQRGPEHFRHCNLSLDEVAALDALAAVAGLARSGDLEIETAPGQLRPITEDEVIASHHRQGRYRSAPVLREVLDQVGERVHAS